MTKSRASDPLIYLFVLKMSIKINFSDKENLTLDLKSSARIRNSKVTNKFSIIKDSSPFKMVKKKTHAYDNELAALELKLS